MTSVVDESELKELAGSLGRRLRGGEVIELTGDVGAGKTTFVKGLSDGLRVQDDIQSPSFTISRVYPARDGLELHHYDFYRLSEGGVMSYELAESIDNNHTVTVVEWAETIDAALPEDRVLITLDPVADDELLRKIWIQTPERFEYLREGTK